MASSILSNVPRLSNSITPLSPMRHRKTRTRLFFFPLALICSHHLFAFSAVDVGVALPAFFSLSAPYSGSWLGSPSCRPPPTLEMAPFCLQNVRVVVNACPFGFTALSAISLYSSVDRNPLPSHVRSSTVLFPLCI